MSEPQIDIERLVREVLAELTRRSDDGACPTVREKKKETPASASARAKTEGELVVTSRVVTMADVDNRLDKARWLVVPPQAIVTPAVRDALRESNVTLAFASSDEPRTREGTRLTMVTAFTSFDPAVLIGALRKEGIDVGASASNCLIETSDTLAQQLRDGEGLALLLTSQVSAALCLANRLSGVRAVTAEDAPGVSQAADSVGANLLVLDPRGKSLFQLKQMIGAFCRPGPRPCPDALRQRLG